MPVIVVLQRMEVLGNQPQLAQDVPLWLPSQIGTKIGFDLRLAEIEWQLRVAQAYELLAQLQNNLQVHLYLYHFKDRYV